ncbi:hypothetical protein [Paenibacillus sp. MBLB4367]|uniref:hypothetical protein n=1 Tax=Paenibacillus sp. MBLB4367 TaxID=3384767 RepID=UPI00390833B1
MGLLFDVVERLSEHPDQADRKSGWPIAIMTSIDDKKKDAEGDKNEKNNRGLR